MRDLLSKLDEIAGFRNEDRAMTDHIQDFVDGGITDELEIRRRIQGMYGRRFDLQSFRQSLEIVKDRMQQSNSSLLQNAKEEYSVHEAEDSESIFQIGDDFGISFTEDFEIGTEIADILEDGVVIDLDEESINYLLQNGFSFEEGELVEGVAGPKSCWKGYRKVGTKPGTGRNAGKRVNDCEKIGEDSDVKEGVAEGYTVIRGIDRERYQERQGLEGPFSAKNGKVVYYDPKEGKYYDPDADMYIDYDDWQAMNEAEYQGRKVPLGKPMAGDVKKSKVYVRGPKGNVVKVNFGDKKMKIKKSNPKRRKSFRARHNCANPGPRWKARYWSCRAW
jgi:hypothetical protein